MKLCTKCAITKSLFEFNKRSDGPGHRAHCKDCSSKDNSARSAAKRNRRKPALGPEEKRESLRQASARHNAKPERKHKQAYYEASRRARKLKATPAWLSEKDKAHMAAYYECAQFLTVYLGIEMEVDHIIPLKGKNVSGLHVPWNLQVMTANENLRKNNKVEHV